jgi:hypothetical protein
MPARTPEESIGKLESLPVEKILALLDAEVISKVT